MPMMYHGHTHEQSHFVFPELFKREDCILLDRQEKGSSEKLNNLLTLSGQAQCHFQVPWAQTHVHLWAASGLR